MAPSNPFLFLHHDHTFIYFNTITFTYFCVFWCTSFVNVELLWLYVSLSWGLLLCFISQSKMCLHNSANAFITCNALVKIHNIGSNVSKCSTLLDRWCCQMYQHHYDNLLVFQSWIGLSNNFLFELFQSLYCI